MIPTDEYIVEMKGISKNFGAIQALDNVDLELRRGEILGLVGDNAAGKSTLMKALFGAVIPNDGQIFVHGRPVIFRNPRDAQGQGIAMVYQDLALFNNLDVAANIFAGRELKRSALGIKFLDKRRMYDETYALFKKLKISNITSPRLVVEHMSGGQRQMVAIIRAIGFDAKILIMDEPTAALGVKESAIVLDLISHLRDQGLSIILITHRLTDVLTIGNRVMVLKGGERQGVLDVKQITLEDIESVIIRGSSALKAH